MTYSVKPGKRDAGTAKCWVKPQPQPDNVSCGFLTMQTFEGVNKILVQLVRSWGCPTQLSGEAQKGPAHGGFGGQKIQNQPLAENHHSPLNWDALATVSDKDRCWERQTWFMTLCFILLGSSTFQAEEFHFKGKDSSQCLASSGKTKTTSVTSTNRYPLFITYLLREYLTSKSNYLKIYFSCHIN